ncbi:hypothetical protein L1049_012326 [Liquidambar formosana]|uniref:Spectrin beta chain, brain n=1 Tax=Liquidambar formosana TaxID=63359 RepID=A0AAP0X0F5_LIQFO
MAGNLRFELTSGSPEESGFSGNYQNGQRGNYHGASLDRSGSFRDGSEGRMFSSGTCSARGNATSTGDLPSLSQCLMLDQITIEEQKYTRSGELRRVLGFSFGSTAEDNSFGAAHAKPPPPVATEELKRFKASVADASKKARVRSKTLDDSLHKLNKFCEALNSKKHQRNELLTTERSIGSKLSKVGTQIQRNPPDIVIQRLEDRTKNVVQNKRVRTSIAEIRAEGRSNAILRQPLVIGKDRDILKDGVAGSDVVEEKIRKLPAGGEGWDKKMKRKRSMHVDADLKRAMHQKLGNEPGLQSCDAQGFRAGSLNGSSGINKLDGSSFPASSNSRGIPKNELEKVSLPRDLSAGLTKERLIAKGNNKLNIRDDYHLVGSSSVTKGKGSRAPRTGPVVVANSSPNFPRSSGALEGWEQSPSANKVQLIGGANNRKRPMPTGSSSPPMAQWVGQRPQKISRTRRANLVSPVSNHDEVQTSSEGCAPSDFGARVTSSGTIGSLPARTVANGTQLKMKLEIVSSPARLSESEESGAGENRLKEKGVGGGEMEERSVNGGQIVGPSALLTKKKILIKEENGDGVRRQGRSGRASPFSRASISPMREKLENPAPTKPLRNIRPGSDKNGSKSGRPPLKKLTDRKALTRLGQTPNCGSPDFTGDSDDDREELLAAAKFASNASYLACSNPFWKKMERIFASVSLGDTSYLKQQLKFAEDLDESLSQMFAYGDDALDDLVHEESSLFQTIVAGERERSLLNHSDSKEPSRTMDLVDQFQDIDALYGRLDSKTRSNKVPPLYERVLSALIIEDEVEEFEENCGGRDVSFGYSSDDSPCGTRLHIDIECRKRGRMEYDYDSILGRETQKQCTLDKSCCNGSSILERRPNILNPLCNGELFQGDSEVEVFPGFSQNDLVGPQTVHINVSGVASFDYQYEQMHLDDKLLLELQSIGLYLETVPDLAEGEEEMINQEIHVLKKGLHQQVGKKKAHLEKIYKAIQEAKDVEGRDLEQIAMNRLSEMAYKKQLATRGSSASKGGVSKVSRQVALAFVKRTVAKCRIFEDTGKSCFSEPPFRDVLLAVAPCINDTESESVNCVGTTVAADVCPEAQNCQPEPRVSGSFPSRSERPDRFETLTHSSDQSFAKNGPISNRGKKKEVLLDDVGGSTSLRATSTIGNTLLGGAKGKRSERERDKDTLGRNSVTKAGRLSLGNFKGERKTKSKPKQKTAQLSTSGNGFVTHSVYPSGSGSSELVTSGSNKKREDGLMTPGSIPQDLSKEVKEPLDFTNLHLHELDPIGELGVTNDLGGPQDLSSWLNFDEDGLQDIDSMGLEIPMDDLSDLNMF